MELALPATSARSAVGSSTLRWSILGLLLGIVVAGLVVAFVTVERHGYGNDPLDKLQSMRHPGSDPALDREQARGEAQKFMSRFTTYGPDLLAKDGSMPKYEALTDEMTSKLAVVFAKNAPMAAATVKQTHVRSTGQVYGVGVSSIDADTAQVIVAGTTSYGYPVPGKKGKWLTSDPERFRYVVSLVKQHGRWLVDDFDNVDDDLPAFGESGGQQGGVAPQPSASQGGSGGAKKGGAAKGSAGGGKR